MNRRQFLVLTGLGGLGGLAELAPSGCSCRRKDRSSLGRDEARGKKPSLVQRATVEPFSMIEVKGGPLEMGEAIGAATRSRIELLLLRRKSWFEELKRYALSDRKSRLDCFAEAVRIHHPDVLAEMKGIARGAGRPWEDILVLNLQTELGAMMSQTTCQGCSTLHLSDGQRTFLAHNEDDHEANRDLMSLIEAHPRGKPAFVSLAYPGVICGNVPAVNDSGIVRTTNYIGATEVRCGVPRYVLGRALLDASTIEEAIRILTNPAGAYSFHVNLGSWRENRLCSIELASQGKHELRRTSNEIYVHTNHFILPRMRSIPQIAVHAGGSSDSRFKVLSRAARGLPRLSDVRGSDLIRLLSSHEAEKRPYSPCRHPEGPVKGRTMATALFDLKARTFTLWEGNPCLNRSVKVGIGRA